MKHILLIILLCIITLPSIAQDKKKFDLESHRKALREQVISRAQLTQEEADKFFEIYFKMREEERAVFDKGKDWKVQDSLTDEECKEAVRQFDSMQVQLKVLAANYHAMMFDELPAKKVWNALKECEIYNRETFRKMSSGAQKRNGKPDKQCK